MRFPNSIYQSSFIFWRSQNQSKHDYQSYKSVYVYFYFLEHIWLESAVHDFSRLVSNLSGVHRKHLGMFYSARMIDVIVFYVFESVFYSHKTNADAYRTLFVALEMCCCVCAVVCIYIYIVFKWILDSVVSYTIIFRFYCYFVAGVKFWMLFLYTYLFKLLLLFILSILLRLLHSLFSDKHKQTEGSTTQWIISMHV